MTMRAPQLFDQLPEFPAALPDDELALLARLPVWDTRMELVEEEHAAARRLEKRGLIKISRWKSDPIALRPDWYAGKLPTASLREAHGELTEQTKER